MLYLTKQGFTLVTRDGIAHSYDKYKTFLFDYSVLSLIFMQAFLCRVIYIIDATDLRVSRRHFVQNLQQYWFLRDKISARAKIYYLWPGQKPNVELPIVRDKTLVVTLI